MRTLRLSLLGTAILVLLAGLGGVALSQDSEVDPSAPHSATAIFSWGGLDEPGETSEDGLSVDGEGWMGNVYSSDDPRLSGATRILRNVVKFESVPGAKQLSGTVRIENDGGAWAGTLRGYKHPETRPNWHLSVELSGEGGYTGHAAVFTTPGRGEGMWEGFVFPTPLLTYPDPMEPFAE